ncbi:hypothetical protein FHW92_004491 [Novosphingobium sp. SG707]|nr:hypothetical protein [Novosphingobium sp. SG707]
MIGSFPPYRMGMQPVYRWPTRQTVGPGNSPAAGAAPIAPDGSAPAVGVAAVIRAGFLSPRRPIVATLTVFEGQAVFHAILPPPDNRILLLRLANGSRQVVPQEILP